LLLNVIAADTKEADRKKKKKKEKKKKKKKDRSRSHSPGSKAAKPSSPDHRISECSNRDASPPVRVKSEFPEDLEKSGHGDRKWNNEKYFSGYKKDARIKEETDRRDVNSADNCSYEHRRRGMDFDISHASQKYLTSNSQVGKRESSDKDRSGTVKSEERSQDQRHNSKPSIKSRAEEELSRHIDGRDGRGKKRMRSASPHKDEDRRRSRDVDRNRNHRHRSPDNRDLRHKTQQRRGSFSDDDHTNRTHTDHSHVTAEHERHHHQRSRSPSNERRKEYRNN